MDEYDDAAFDQLGSAALDRISAGPSVPTGAGGGGSSAGGRSFPVQPVPNKQLRPGYNAIVASARQKGNPVLSHIKNVPWEYGEHDADFVLGATTCCFFLSLKYHRLHPEYIYNRMTKLGRSAYNLRILLVLCDVDNHADALRELTKTAVVNNYTLLVAWSTAEAGRYLEAFKVLEHAPPTQIRERVSYKYSDQIVEALTAVRAVNRTDALAAVGTFGSFDGCVRAAAVAAAGGGGGGGGAGTGTMGGANGVGAEDIGAIPGWGPNKVKNWQAACTTPFRVTHATTRVQQVEAAMSQRAATDAAANAIHNASVSVPST